MAKANKPSNDQAAAKAAMSKLMRVLQAKQTIEVNRGDIAFADYNPRQIKPAAFRLLVESVSRNGLVVDPVVNKRSQEKGWPKGSQLTFVGGHQRVKALDHIGKTTDYAMQISLVDVDKNDERSMNIALNNPMMQAEFDQELLEQVLVGIAESGGDPADTGFSRSHLNLIFSDESVAKMFGEQQAAESGYVDKLMAIREAANEARQDAVAAGDAPVDLFGAGDGTPPPEQAVISQREAVKLDLKEKRRVYKDQQAAADDGDTQLTLVFDSSACLQRFMNAFEIATTDRYIDAVDVLNAMGIDLDLDAE